MTQNYQAHKGTSKHSIRIRLITHFENFKLQSTTLYLDKLNKKCLQGDLLVAIPRLPRFRWEVALQGNEVVSSTLASNPWGLLFH